MYNVGYWIFCEIKTHLALDHSARWRNECHDTIGILLANVIANRLGMQWKLKKKKKQASTVAQCGQLVWTCYPSMAGKG